MSLIILIFVGCEVAMCYVVFAHLVNMLSVVVELKQEEYGAGCQEQHQQCGLVHSGHE